MADPKYLLTAQEVEAMEGVEKTHFLNANAKRNNKSLGDVTGLTGFGFHIIEVEPGQETTEHHVHHHEDECVYVLAGEAVAYIGDETVPIESGDFLGYRKGGLAHSIKNTGTETLRGIVVGERHAHAVGDYPRLAKRSYRNTGVEWNLVDHAPIEKPIAGKK